MTLNILVGELQAKEKPVKRGESDIETGFRGINDTSKNVGNRKGTIMYGHDRHHTTILSIIHNMSTTCFDQ